LKNNSEFQEEKKSKTNLDLLKNQVRKVLVPRIIQKTSWINLILTRIYIASRKEIPSSRKESKPKQ